jgi:hypothetical protein
MSKKIKAKAPSKAKETAKETAKAPEKAAVPEKRPVGRPSSYKPEYCIRIVEMAKEGVGPAGYASKFEVDKATLYKWADTHEEFRIALSRAKTEEQHWWENAGRTGIFADKFNALVWHKSMAAKFRDDYTERSTTELVGKGGGPVQVETSMIDPRNMTPEQREALKVVMLALKGEAK